MSESEIMAKLTLDRKIELLNWYYRQAWGTQKVCISGDGTKFKITFTRNDLTNTLVVADDNEISFARKSHTRSCLDYLFIVGREDIDVLMAYTIEVRNLDLSYGYRWEIEEVEEAGHTVAGITPLAVNFSFFTIKCRRNNCSTPYFWHFDDGDVTLSLHSSWNDKNSHMTDYCMGDLLTLNEVNQKQGYENC